MASAVGSGQADEPMLREASSGMQLVSRVAAILRALEGQAVGLSLGQIAKATGLPRATVQRVVDALVVEQLVAPDAVNGGVRLGPAFVRMALSAYTDFRSLARPYLEALCKDLRETVVLTVLRDRKAVFVDQVIADRPTQVTTRPGAALELHATAAGKALLATVPGETIPHMLGTRLERATTNTIVDAAKVAAEIAAMGADGFAYDREEWAEGVCAVAVPVRDVTGAAYSISVTTPAGRFDAMLDRCRVQLQLCRQQIEAAAGFNQEPCSHPAD